MVLETYIPFVSKRREGRCSRKPLGFARSGKRLWVVLLGCALAAVPCAASRMVVDETGRVVVVPDHPHRVICLVPSVVDSVYAIGAGEDVVGVSDYVAYPMEAKRKPSVGTVLTPSLEVIISLKPDLLLAMKTESGAGAVEKLRKMGVPIFLVDPHGIEGIFRSIVSLGEVLNRRGAAEREVAGLRGRLAAVRGAVRGRPVVRVFLPLWYDPVITIGKGAYLTEMIAAAGGESVTSDLRQEWPQVSLEAVVERAPDALLLGKGGGVTLEVLRKKPGWGALAAVRDARFFFLDRKMDLASPVAFDGLEELAREFHP